MNKIYLLKNGESFGEIALTTQEGTRTATIVAMKNSQFATISAEAYRKIISENI